MADFEVEYFDIITLKYIISKVYAVDSKNFLIINDKNDFEWVPIIDCKPFGIVYATVEVKE